MVCQSVAKEVAVVSLVVFETALLRADEVAILVGNFVS
jgi:hypothetical protein